MTSFISCSTTLHHHFMTGGQTVMQVYSARNENAGGLDPAGVSRSRGVYFSTSFAEGSRHRRTVEAEAIRPARTRCDQSRFFGCSFNSYSSKVTANGRLLELTADMPTLSFCGHTVWIGLRSFQVLPSNE